LVTATRGPWAILFAAKGLRRRLLGLAGVALIDVSPEVGVDGPAGTPSRDSRAAGCHPCRGSRVGPEPGSALAPLHGLSWR
jgi:hypothetical protein